MCSISFLHHSLLNSCSFVCFSASCRDVNILFLMMTWFAHLVTLMEVNYCSLLSSDICIPFVRVWFVMISIRWRRGEHISDISFRLRSVARFRKQRSWRGGLAAAGRPAQVACGHTDHMLFSLLPRAVGPAGTEVQCTLQA